MSAEQSEMFHDKHYPRPPAWRDYRRDPVPHIRHLPVDEQIKHCAARFVWRHRDEMCPSPHRYDDGTVTTISWATWFAIRYGTTIDEFQRQHQHLKGK